MLLFNINSQSNHFKTVGVESIKFFIEVIIRIRVFLRQCFQELSFLTFAMKLIPTIFIFGWTGQICRQHLFPAVFIVVFTRQIGHLFFPAFYIANIARKFIHLIFPAVNISLIAVEIDIKLILSAVYICNLTGLIQVKLFIVLVHCI